MTALERARRAYNRWYSWGDPLPTWSDSHDWLAELYTLRFEELDTIPKSTIPDFDVPLSNSEIHRLRYARSLKIKPQFSVLGERWGRSFSLLFSESNLQYHYVRVALHFLINDLKILEIPHAYQLFAVLKKTTEIFKTHNDKISQAWRYLINLETFGWYVTGEFTQEHKDEVIDWVVTKHPHYINGSEEAFEQAFKCEVFHFFEENAAREHQFSIPTAQEWLDNPDNYCRSGSTHMNVEVRVDQERPRKSKTAAYLSRSKSFFQKMIFTKQRYKATIIMKKETGKVRPVINADDASYLQMSFVSSWLEPFLQGNRNSTLWMSTKQVLDMKINTVMQLQAMRTALPLDQSHFDHQPTMAMLQSTFSAIKAFAPRDDLKYVTGLIAESIAEGTIVELPDGSKLTHKKGVLSGWRWTAMIDTIINIVTFRLATRLSGLTRPLAVRLFNAQGDDDLIFVDNNVDAELIAASYQAMNFEVNTKKFFISKRYQEYLRIVYDRDGSYGYPARSIVSLLINNPINPDPPAGTSRIRAAYSNWMIAINRRLSCYHEMLEDISRGNGVSESFVEEWLHTPATLGGCGWQPWSEKTEYTVLSDSIIKRHGKISGIHLVPVRQSAAFREAILERLETHNNLEVVPMQVSTYPKLEPFKRLCTCGERLTPRYADLKNSFLNDIKYREFLDAKDYKSAVAMLDDDSRRVATRLARRASRWVFLAYLRSELPFSQPYVYGWDPGDASPIWHEYEMRAFATALQFRHITKQTIIRAGLLAERLFPYELEGMRLAR